MRLEPCILCFFLTPPPPRLEKHEAWCWWWRWGQWWPWFFSRLGREMVTYLVYPGSTTGSPLNLTHCRTIMGWSSVHGKRRENIKKGLRSQRLLQKKTLISLLPGWSKWQWQGSSSSVTSSLLICPSPTPLLIGLPQKLVFKRTEILFCYIDRIVAQSK